MMKSSDSVAIMEGKDPKNGQAVQYILKPGQTAIKTTQLGSKTFVPNKNTKRKSISLDETSVIIRISERGITYGIPEAKEKANRLAKFHSVTPFTIYSDHKGNRELILAAQNGGKDLNEIKNTIPLDSFKDLIYELPIMHRRGLYPTDIKLENLVFKNRKVRHIDVEDMPASKNDLRMRGIVHTPYTTHADIIKEHCDYRQGKSTLQAQILLEKHSTCALMLTMMIATDRNLYKQALTGNIWSSPYFVPEKDLSLLITWVRQNIKAEHQYNVISFLSYPIINELGDTLYNLIQWKSDTAPVQGERQLPNWGFVKKGFFDAA